MSYFRPFPFIKDYEIQGKTYTGMDITRRTGFSANTKSNDQLFIEYEVRDGETPEMLADRIYDNVDLYWVIMLFNDIHDIDADWPISQVSLERYINRVYDDPYAIHHYESAATGSWVDSDHIEYDRIPVTNYEYEVRMNDSKRKVKIPVPDSIGRLKELHRELIRV